MKNWNVKSHSNDRIYAQPHYFILNKGLNSGKPLKEPCPDCFVMLFYSDEVAQEYYYIQLALWKANFWKPFLIGSVIPFLRLDDFKSYFDLKTRQMLQDHKAHQNDVNQLKRVLEFETNQYKKMLLIEELKKAIIYRMCQ
jgi:hypothetical protein